jgi:osmotically-inducible protein OsmY
MAFFQQEERTMAKQQTRERTNRTRNRSEWDDDGRDQERGPRFSEYEEGDDDWRYRTSERNERPSSRREGGWRPSEYGRDEGEHFPWGGGTGPVRWSEGRRGRASEEDWRGNEQMFDERTRGSSRGRPGTSGWDEGQYGQGSYGQRGGYREDPFGSHGGYDGYGQNWSGQGSYGSQGRYGSQGMSGYGQGSYGYRGTGRGTWGSQGYFDSDSRNTGSGTSHYGRGPKGYKRSDERIREDVNEALYRDHEIDASDIDVQVHEGEVTLSGSVDRREAKRIAEDCVWSVSGVRDVTVMLKVTDEQGRSSDKDGGSESSRNKNKTATAGASSS